MTDGSNEAIDPVRQFALPDGPGPAPGAQAMSEAFSLTARALFGTMQERYVRPTKRGASAVGAGDAHPAGPV